MKYFSELVAKMRLAAPYFVKNGSRDCFLSKTAGQKTTLPPFFLLWHDDSQFGDKLLSVASRAAVNVALLGQ